MGGVKTLFLRLFGEMRASHENGVLRPLGVSRKTQLLLAYLVLHRDQVGARADIAFTLWPDDAESEARANLRRHMYELQRYFPNDQLALQVDARTVRIDPRCAMAVDFDAFWSAVALGSYAEATDIYAGELLQSYGDEWILPIRGRARRAYERALRSLIDAHWQTDAALALEYAERLLTEDPWREDVVRAAMELRVRLGDRAGALDVYRTFSKRLAEEFNASPSDETTELYLRTGAVSTLSAELSVSPLLSLDQPWVRQFPWWWVARLKHAPNALAVAAYLRTIASGEETAPFQVPREAHQRLEVTRMVFDAGLRMLVRQGVIEIVDARSQTFRFAFTDPTKRARNEMIRRARSS
jgi:DNA-binding SARP family transcriptional activator